MKVTKKAIVFLMLLMLIIQVPFNALSEESTTETKVTQAFSDVDSDNWAYEAISWMVDKKILQAIMMGRLSRLRLLPELNLRKLWF